MIKFWLGYKSTIFCLIDVSFRCIELNGFNSKVHEVFFLSLYYKPSERDTSFKSTAKTK